MKIIWYPATTLDGLIADDVGGSDWVSDADGALFEDEIKKAGCAIVGMTTFEQYKGSLYPIEGAVTYVVTSKAKELVSNESVRYVLPNAEAICSRVAADGFTSAILSGGGKTNGLFAASNKIDEALISIYPMVLGSGIKMLGDFTGKLKLELVGTKEIGDGVIQNRYNVSL